MDMRWRHWLCALGFALFTHAAIAAGLTWQKQPDGNAEMGVKGIEFSLGSMSAAAGTVSARESVKAAPPPVPEPEPTLPVETSEPPMPVTTEVIERVEDVPEVEAPTPEVVEMPSHETVEVVETVVPPEAPEEIDRPQPVAEPEVAALRLTDALPPVEDADIALPKETLVVEKQPAPDVRRPLPLRKPTPPVKTAEVSEPSRQPKLVSEAPAMVAAAEPQKQMPTRPDDAELHKERPDEASAASDAGAGGDSGAGTEAGADDQLAHSGASGKQGASPEYYSRLIAWLERYKEYPRRAKKRHMEGTTYLYFVMDRAGSVLRHSIRQSSGYKILDREIEAMLSRAQPLPPFPEDLQTSQLELVIPFQFILR